jgi:hypothetical protein
MTDKRKNKVMKKTILAVTLLALAVASVQNARAGDREWALAGKVLTGLAAASLISRVVAPPHVYAYSSGYAYAPGYAYAAPSYNYNYCPPPVRYCPPPAVVYAPVCAPPVVYRAPAYPVYRAPAPVVGFSFNVGGGNHFRRGCW